MWKCFTTSLMSPEITINSQSPTASLPSGGRQYEKTNIYLRYMAKGYTDKEAIENYLQIDIDDSFDAQITEWIEAAENIVDQETNRDFTPQADPAVATERIFDGDGSDTLDINGASDITEVTLYADGEPIAATQYVTYPANATNKNKIQLRYLKFPEGIQNITVKAKFGLAKVPADIKLATTMLVGSVILEAWEEPNQVQSMTVGRYTVSYKTVQQLDQVGSLQEIFDRNKRYHF